MRSQAKTFMQFSGLFRRGHSGSVYYYGTSNRAGRSTSQKEHFSEQPDHLVDGIESLMEKYDHTEVKSHKQRRTLRKMDKSSQGTGHAHGKRDSTYDLRRGAACYSRSNDEFPDGIERRANPKVNRPARIPQSWNR